jgi:hypothetical protein
LLLQARSAADVGQYWFCCACCCCNWSTWSTAPWHLAAASIFVAASLRPLGSVSCKQFRFVQGIWGVWGSAIGAVRVAYLCSHAGKSLAGGCTPLVLEGLACGSLGHGEDAGLVAVSKKF